MNLMKILPVASQVLGVLAVLFAVWILTGPALALLTGGLVLVVVGTLAEGGKL